MIRASYNLDMTPRRSLPIIINVSQNDDLGRTLVFNLFSSTGTWTAPDSATATLEGGKPDGKFFSYTCTYSKGVVTAIIQQQMTAVSGKVTCKVKVQSGNKVIESAPIYMMVDAAGIPDGADMSKSDVNDAVAKATQKIVEQVAGSIPEDYSALNNSVDELKQDLKSFDYNYLPYYIEANQNKYWIGVDSKLSENGFYAFEPFEVTAGTYYYHNVVKDFCYAKSQSGAVTTLSRNATSDFEVVKFEEKTILYLTTADNVGKEHAFFGNYPTTKKDFYKYGLNSIPLKYISDINDSFVPTQYLDKEKGIDARYWQDKGQINNADNYFAYAPIILKKGTYYYRNISGYFTFFYGLKTKTTTKPFNDSSHEVTLNEDGILYVSVSKTIFDHEDSILCDAKYPVSLKQSKGKLFNFVPKYQLIGNNNDNYLLKNQYYATGGATLNGNVCTIHTDDNGINTQTFNTVSSTVKVDYDFDNTGTEVIRVYLDIIKSDNAHKYVKKYDSNKNGRVTGSFIFDASSYSVYEDAKEYRVLIWSSAGSSFALYNVSIQEISRLETSSYYKDNLEDMLSSLSDGLDNIESKIVSSSIILRNPNGTKYGLQVDSNGNLVAYSYVPSKYIVMGNSITCGMDNSERHGGRFGMAATSFDKDWVYYVDSAIKEKNSNATYTRIYSSPFEHSETSSSANEWITSNSSSFDQDTDLVIIEMGDNVNTDAKRSVFANSFPILLHTIRTLCPKARVVCVGIWFNNSIVKAIMLNACEKYGCSFVNISDLNIASNQAVVGDTVTFLDGTVSTITSEIATHPGNNGMKLIADRIIENLDM